ncbi:MAG TPA: hypothetical protein VL860_03910 [Planctomycetota bacterium]|nr:hypothetical protein [Planctomycetota bacterium]
MKTINQIGVWAGCLWVGTVSLVAGQGEPTLAPPPPPPPVEVSAAPPKDAKPESPATADAWQNKIQTKVDPKNAPVKTGPAPLDDAGKKLGTDLAARQTTMNASRNAMKAMDYFVAQWDILAAMPEFAYAGHTARDQIAATDKGVAVYLRTNKKTLDELEDLVILHKQRLGLKGVQVNVPAKPAPRRRSAGLEGTVVEPATAADTPDVTLDNTLKDGKNPPLKLTNKDLFKISSFESYVKRLQTYAFRHDWGTAENEYQYAADNIAGAYLFQLMVQQDGRWAWTYPETFKWLQKLDGGNAVIPAEDLPKPPAAPAKPGAPALPAAPAAPAVPATPAAAAAPATPATPGTPVVPAAPGTPVAPATPATPATPTASATPAAAVTPATPAASASETKTKEKEPAPGTAPAPVPAPKVP